MTNQIPTVARVVIAVIALAIATAAATVVPTPVAAQTTPLCPSSIAPVKGGLGSPATLGYDDGVRGGDVAYEPGQIVVVLQRGRTAKDLQCVADELRAVIVDGGAGRRGVGGIPNAVILQLQPGISVRKTAEKLLQPRYRRLILAAQPAAISEELREDGSKDPTVNDPLFPVQWGLTNSGMIPDEANPFPVPFTDADLVANPFTSARAANRYSIRVRQAWRLLSRQATPGVGMTRVAIVDDSLAQHPDLVANVAKDGNARYNGESGGLRIELLKNAGTTDFTLRDQWGVNRNLCSLAWDSTTKRPDSAWLAATIASQTDASCSKKRLPTTWNVTMENAYRGTLVFTYGGEDSAPVDVTDLWRERGDHAAVMRRVELAIAALINKNKPDVTQVHAVFREPQRWDDSEDLTRELRIVLYGADRPLGINTTGLVSTAFPIAAIPPSGVTDASTTGQVGYLFATGGSFQIRYSLTIQNPLLGPQDAYTVEVTSGEIFIEGAGYGPAEVQTSLQSARAIYEAGLPPNDPRAGAISGFSVNGVRGYPRAYVVTVQRPVPDTSWIVDEQFSVVSATGITSAIPTGRVRGFRPRGTLTEAKEGFTISLLGLPAVGRLKATVPPESGKPRPGPVNPNVATGNLADEDSIERISAAQIWPGQVDADAGHGQFIAGVIGATANNGIGMAGVIGDTTVTKRNIKMNGLIGTLALPSTLNRLEYAESRLRAEVVNYSIGGDTVAVREVDLYRADVPIGDRNDVLRGQDPMAVDSVNLLMGSVTNASRTLFVVAAGNSGSDLRRPKASLEAQLQRRLDRSVEAFEKKNGRSPDAKETKALLDSLKRKISRGEIKITVNVNPCRPKGMGVTERPFGGVGNDRASTKGGALSMLRMPDGTFDRGNILCVASADWNGQLSDFSNWGPGIVDVAAPGSNIVGTLPGNGYKVADGTSFAAPLVAGVAAMVYSVLPDAEPWLVKCAILSSATSRPLRTPNTAQAPYTYLTQQLNNRAVIPYPKESPLTVYGMVQASEALDAAISLDTRVRRAKDGSGSWPTCVQKRGFFGGWKNTTVLRG